MKRPNTVIIRLRLKGVLFGVPPISKPTQNEEAQPTLRPRIGFEPVRLETPRIPEHAWFHCNNFHGKIHGCSLLLHGKLGIRTITNNT
ncbi:hypothetical protein E2C01_102020 [Portunus trituberculatus]|uniref:Uncharacterized protein n=1 Tax=Portunus trituberculatus TaxID=210409 RepID=A0A5B7KC30_PORTR|nr:hypothetical protein [Portunus trituberculatus]